VIVLETGVDKPEVVTALTQQPDGSITLDAYLASLHKEAQGSNMSIDRRGVIGGWVAAQDWVNWDFKVFEPGTFEVVAVTAPPARGATWDGGHKLTVEVAGSKLETTMTQDGDQVDPSNPHTKFFVSKLGRVTIEKAGPYQLALKPSSIEAQRKGGLTLATLKLVPVR
jgi:hypothetical protein